MSAKYKVETRQSDELIGDLATLPDSKLSDVGRAIKLILSGDKDAKPQNYKDVYSAKMPGKDSQECRADTCCIWKYIADEMMGVMMGDAGRCNLYARGAIRLGFHDAGTYSKKANAGGADGSIINFDECDTRVVNKGLSETCELMRMWYKKYSHYGISMADLIQFGANVGTVACPQGPRVRTYVGRKDGTRPSPDDTMPLQTWAADELLPLFADKTISPQGLVSLVGAHTTSQQRFAYPEHALEPQDSTPGVWDIDFYQETMNPNTPARILKFPSDVHLADDSRTKNAFAMYGDQDWGQAMWNQGYAREYVRLSLLGVNNINDLVDCTKALPQATSKTFRSPDQDRINQYISGEDDPGAAMALNLGNLIS